MIDKQTLIEMQADQTYGKFVSNWRPAMGWLYMVLVAFDFIIAPVGMPYLWKLTNMTPYPWKPLTLEGGGFIHMTFAAILGIAAWTRGQEKVAMLEKQGELFKEIPEREEEPKKE